MNKETVAERIARKFYEIQETVKDKGERNEKKVVAAFGDPKWNEDIDPDLGIPYWFKSIRNATTLEQPAGMDVVVWTDLSIAIPVQIKSSPEGLEKFQAAQENSKKYKTGILFPIIKCPRRKKKEKMKILINIPAVVIDEKNYDAIIIRHMIVDSVRPLYHALLDEYARSCGFNFIKAA